MAKLPTTTIFNEIITPFRWYDNDLKRNENNPYCKNECKFKLMTLQQCMLPFMLVRDASQNAITEWKLISEAGTVVASLNTSLINIVNLGTKDYVIYNGEWFDFLMDCGKFYYSQVSDGVNTWYSERFFVTQSAYCGNLLTNPSFDNGFTGWTHDGNVAIIGGLCEFTGAGYITQNVALNKFVKLTIKITSFVGAAVTVQIGAGDPVAITGNGEFVMYGYTGASGTIMIVTDEFATGTFNMDDLVLGEISDQTHDCSTIFEWYSDCDFGTTYYNGGFKNRFILETEARLGLPTYKITKEGVTDGDGNFVEQFRKRQKVYRIETGLIPEYLVDAIVDMQLLPTKKVLLPNCIGGEEIRDVTVTPQFEFSGCYANVVIQFSIDDVTEAGCCNDISSCAIPCQEGVVNELTGECVEGTKYFGETNDNDTLSHEGEILECDGDGNLNPIPCANGVVTDEDDKYWAMSPFGNFLKAPQVLAVVPTADPNVVNVTCWIMPNSYGQLYISSDGGGTYEPIGSVMDQADWVNTGYDIELTAGTEYLFKIKNTKAGCDYGYSAAVAAKVPDTETECMMCVEIPYVSSYYMGVIHYDDGSPQEINLSTIKMKEFADLKSILDSAGVGTWYVSYTGLTLMLCVIQPKPAAFAFSNIEYTDNAEDNDFIVDFEGDC